ncbi:neurogenic protein big brain [Stomoxys calcitrans]|uniref:Neurogenic protein big brain n=1 Tax=Stomoxys calcitrans TaxID=35570 RepID=A0A1I8Q664_STOCA|nr:neurogenic protein big brain [Stomoxys calcitrans]
MADETLQTIPLENNIDAHIVTLFERLEAIRRDNQCNAINNRLSSTLQPKRSMQAEIRTLEFWRSIISECLASFFYVFIVCGAAAGAGVGASVSSVLLATALASGLAMGTLTQCFLHISGAHINPAVTLASCVIRSISPLRAAMYITAQCGGGIAGAALLYGVTVPGYQGNLQAAISHSATLAAWERFGVEFILTFVVVLTYFVSTDSVKKIMGHSASSIAAAYSACSFVSMPYLNPARSLGPSFVLNKWDNHWVYWFGPLVGGIASGIVYEFIFSSKRNARHIKAAMDNESSSINSEDELNYDLDMEKQTMQTKYQGTFQRAQNTNMPSTQNSGGGSGGGVGVVASSGPSGGTGNYCQNLYTAPPKFDQPQEPLYGGTRSMYCRSPTLTRTNLNRSQSVYAKSNTNINRDIVPRSGPLVPAQSLYRMNIQQNQQQQHQQQQQQQQQHQQSSHLQNQNVQNQLQQRSESIYGMRTSNRQNQQQPQHQGQMPHHLTGQLMQHQPPPPAPNQQQQQQQQQQQLHSQQPQDNGPQSFQSVYGTRHNPNPTDGNIKFERRPESVYGMTVPRNRGQSAQSDDSSYGSYHGSSMTPPARIPSTEPPMIMYAPPPQPNPHQVSSSSQAPMRTQSERKVSAPVVASQASTMTSTTTTIGQFSTSQATPTHPTPSHTQQQQPPSQQQQMMAQHHQQSQQQQQQPPPPAHPQQHYGMMPMRSN